ncbi:hypothetical protein [Mumia sp. Pv 4-285]|uniref:hypothetical protein n=1 Tax=Mumia qirimensis TaxID=3234852 RepID=UPI00351D420F
MIRPIRTLAVGAAAVALVVGVSASPAAAKTRTFTDKSDDAVAALDITKVKVKNKKHVVVIRASVPGLDKAKVGGVSVGIRTKAKGRPEYALSKVRAEGRWMPVTFMDLKSEDIMVSCKGDRISFGKKSVTVRIPQRCLGANKKAVRVGVALFGRDLDEVMIDEEPTSGPDAQFDVYPTIASNRLSPWVRYR